MRATGGLAHRDHDLLEVAAGGADEQHPAAFVADRVAVRDVARAEGVVAGADLERLLADLDRRRALEDAERLVLAVMDVQRRLGPGRLGHLDDRHLPAGVGPCRPDHGEAAEPPACVSLVSPNERPAPASVSSARSLLLLGLVVDGQKRDRVAPGAVGAAAHDIRALCREHERDVVGLDDAPGVGDVRVVVRPQGRRRPRDLPVPARLACAPPATSRARASNSAASACRVAEHERVLEQRLELLGCACSLPHGGRRYGRRRPVCLFQKSGVCEGAGAPYPALMSGYRKGASARADRRACRAGPRPRHVLAGVHRVLLEPAVPHYDKPCWYTLDPASLLITSHYHDGLPEFPPEALKHEYYGDDVNKISDVARSERRDLDAARGDRRRPVLEPGVAHEHGHGRRPGADRRHADGRGRGLGGGRSLSRARRAHVRQRREGVPQGDRTRPGGRARARRFWSARPATRNGRTRPGSSSSRPTGDVESTTPGVERWLSDLPDGDWDAGRLPSAVHAVASRALRTAEGPEDAGRGRTGARALAVGDLGRPARHLSRRRRDRGEPR